MPVLMSAMAAGPRRLRAAERAWGRRRLGGGGPGEEEQEERERSGGRGEERRRGEAASSRQRQEPGGRGAARNLLKATERRRDAPGPAATRSGVGRKREGRSQKSECPGSAHSDGAEGQEEKGKQQVQNLEAAGVLLRWSVCRGRLRKGQIFFAKKKWGEERRGKGMPEGCGNQRDWSCSQVEGQGWCQLDHLDHPGQRVYPSPPVCSRTAGPLSALSPEEKLTGKSRLCRSQSGSRERREGPILAFV